MLEQSKTPLPLTPTPAKPTEGAPLKRRHNSLQHEFWIDELAYLESIDVRDPGPAFNHTPACFASHCEMQARGADAVGEHVIAGHIRAIAAACTAGWEI